MNREHRVPAVRTVVLMLLCTVLAGGAPATGALAASWRDLQGSYAITAADMLDPAADAAPDTHFRLQLRGLSARDLYNAMQVTPAVDQCTGGRLKAVNNLRCVHFEDSGRYQCDFALNLLNASVEIGIPC